MKTDVIQYELARHSTDSVLSMGTLPQLNRQTLGGHMKTIAIFTILMGLGGCTTNCSLLTREECALLGKYGPVGAAFEGISLDLASDHSAVVQKWTDAGPHTRTYKCSWSLRNDTLIVNSNPLPKYKNYSMIEQVVAGQSDIFVRVMNLDSTRVLNERWISQNPWNSPSPNLRVDALMRNEAADSMVVSSVFGEHRIPVTVRAANRFTIFVQLPSSIPEFIVDMRFLVKADGSLAQRLENGTFSDFSLVRD